MWIWKEQLNENPTRRTEANNYDHKPMRGNQTKPLIQTIISLGCDITV